MVKNYYYFVAGILAFIFAVTHALNGQNNVLPSLERSSTDMQLRTVLFYVWHIITAENVVFGIAFLYMSFQRKSSLARFAAIVIAFLLVARWIMIVLATIVFDAGLKNILVDSAAIAIYVSLIIVGIRVKRS
jgi:hypothetical protein